MQDVAEFKSSRASNAGLGLGLLAIFGCAAGLPFYASEDSFLHTHVRRGGMMKLIEQTIGWPLFCVLMIAFGLWCAVYGVVHLWKAFDATPDVTAHNDRLTFHPAVKPSPANYEEIAYWKIELVSGHPVLWLHFHEAYWSLQGLFNRKTVKLEGGREKILPFAEFLFNNQHMAEKFVKD